MLDEIIGDIDIPQDHVTALRHIILSHHGQYEWGSPKMPKTLEAMILHFADNLDSKIEGVSKVQKEARERGMMWTARFDGRPFFCEQITEQTIDRPVEGELF
jgi:3'-5' exoribonuclease